MLKSTFIAVLCLLFSTMAIADAPLKVFACEPEWKALVEHLGGDRVKAFSATHAFQDPHYIEARPSLIAKARQAELLVCTGAELEVGWLPLLLRRAGNAAIQVGEPGYFLGAMQVERIEIPSEMDRSHGDVHASGNPHVYWDPYRLLKIATALSARLERIDPMHREYYQNQLKAFATKWQKSIGNWEQSAAKLRGKKAVVYHKNWSYLLAWLGVEMVGDLEPKPGLPPTSAHLAALLKEVRADKPDFILLANYQDAKGAKWLSEKADVPKIDLPFTIDGDKRANDLFSLYEIVLSRLNQLYSVRDK